MKIRTRVFEGDAVQWTGHNSAEMCELLGLKESWLEGDTFVAEPIPNPVFGCPDYYIRIRLYEWAVRIGNGIQYYSAEEFNERYDVL